MQGKSLVTINKSNPENFKGYSRYHKGFTVTTNDYSYTKWANKENTFKTDMMYNLKNDPDENINISVIRNNDSVINKFRYLLDSVSSVD